MDRYYIFLIGLSLGCAISLIITMFPEKNHKDPLDSFKPKYSETQLAYFIGCTSKGFELAKGKEEFRYVDSSCNEEMLRFK